MLQKYDKSCRKFQKVDKRCKKLSVATLSLDWNNCQFLTAMVFFHDIFETAVFVILFAITIPNLDLAQSAQMAEIKLFQPLKGTQCM